MSAAPDLTIAQAVLLADARGVKVAAASAGFDAPEAERIIGLFGARTAGAACPVAHFACPFGTDRVVVVRVEDRPGHESPLGFRFLVLSRTLYRMLGDPFAVADRFPPDWTAAGELPVLAWPNEGLPVRTVTQLQGVLKTGDTPLLLGSTQALVDGSRVILKRATPDDAFVRGLWQLLPDRTRCELWPASFAFSNDLGFHAACLPEPPPDPAGIRYTEDGLRNYPQGRYELSLQIVVEAGDAAGLRSLLARRTAGESFRLLIYLIVGAFVLAATAKLLG